MRSLRFCLVLLLSVVLFGDVHCSRPKGVDQPKKKTLTFEEDCKATSEAYEKAKSKEEKLQLVFGCLQRNKKDPRVLELVESIAVECFLKEWKDPHQMIAFAREQTSDITDPKLKKQVDSLLIKLYGEAGDQEGLRKYVDNLRSKRELLLSEHETIAEAAIKTRDWEMALLQAETLLKRNTAEIIHAETGNQAISDQQVKDAIANNRCHGLLLNGRILTAKGDFDQAIATYKNAGQLATYNYVGYPKYPFSDLNLLWAQALLEKGDFKAAIEKVSVDAIICERKDALEILKKAFDSAKLGSDLEGFINRTRIRIAKSIPEFQAADLDGKKVRYGGLKGKVTLISLWSPFCPPCRVELPRLKPVYMEFHKRGLEIVVVDGLNDAKNSLKFVKETGLPYRFLEAGTMDGKIERGLFGFPSFPTSYLVDKNGKLIYTHIGYLAGDEEKSRKKIAQLLNN